MPIDHCDNCNRRVLLRDDGTCPSCGTEIVSTNSDPGGRGERDRPPPIPKGITREAKPARPFSMQFVHNLLAIFLLSLLLGLGLVLFATIELGRLPGAPLLLLASAPQAGGGLAPPILGLLAGWRMWSVKPFLLATMVAGLWVGGLGAAFLLVIFVIVPYVGSYYLRQLKNFYFPIDYDDSKDAADPDLGHETSSECEEDSMREP